MKKLLLFLSVFLFQLTVNKEVNASEDTFVQVSVSPSPAFVNSQIKYTLKLYDRIGIISSHITPPSMPGVEFRQLGKERRYIENYQEQDYLVLEWQYAFFLPSAGTFSIIPPRLSGESNGKVISGEPEFYTKRGLINPTPFKNMTFEKSEQIYLKGQKLSVTVLPLPEKQNLFVADSMSLVESWTPSSGEVKNGETLTRTFTLNARGANPKSMPSLLPPAPEGIKSFAGKPVLHLNVKDKDTYVKILQSIVFVPDSDGAYTFPEFTFSWFNSREGREEEISFPPFKVNLYSAKESEDAILPAQQYEEERPFYADYGIYKWFSSLDKDSLQETVFLVIFVVLLLELLVVRIRKRLRNKRK
ncbi:MAG: BatD family protein [Alphaproteobacteria bacterium]|nr:BatD family protein [Alphaproteobacteria bacterium]